MTADLTVVHLYPELLRTYGDRGNVLTLLRRAEWRGFRAQVVGVGVGDPLPSRSSILVIGGGTDRVQGVVAADVTARRETIREAASGGCVILGVCGGYQFLGHSYLAADGSALPGLGLLDVETSAETSAPRIVGPVKASAHLWGRDFELVGFENHRGRTRGSVPWRRRWPACGDAKATTEGIGPRARCRAS